MPEAFRGGTAPQQPGPTEYVILIATDAGWAPEPNKQTARSSDQAIRQAAEARMKAGSDPNGMYVAVPARSWKPQPVKVETTFRLGGAT